MNVRAPVQRETDLGRTKTSTDSGRQQCTVPGCPFWVRVMASSGAEALRLAKLAYEAHACVPTPPGWPPQLGDVWRVDDEGLVAVRIHYGEIEAVVLNCQESSSEQLDVFTFAQHNPVLVTRVEP